MQLLIESFLRNGHGDKKSPILYPVSNIFYNLIGSLGGPDFPISAQGHGNAYVRFCPFVYKVFFEKTKKNKNKNKKKKQLSSSS